MVRGNWVDVAEAAERLDVSPQRIRQLIANGTLNAQHISDRWAIAAATIEDYQHLSPPRGRPLSPATAWKQLRHGPDNLPPEQLDRWRRRLRVRANWHRYRVHPAGLTRLRADQRIVLSGRDAIAEHAPVDPDPDRVIAYTRDTDLKDLTTALHLKPERDTWNVELGTINPTIWPFKQQRHADPITAWLDLLDHRDRAADTAAIAAHDATRLNDA